MSSRPSIHHPSAVTRRRERPVLFVLDHDRRSLRSLLSALSRRYGADSVNLVLPPNRPEDELAEILNVAARAACADGRPAIHP